MNRVKRKDIITTRRYTKEELIDNIFRQINRLQYRVKELEKQRLEYKDLLIKVLIRERLQLLLLRPRLG